MESPPVAYHLSPVAYHLSFTFLNRSDLSTVMYTHAPLRASKLEKKFMTSKRNDIFGSQSLGTPGLKKIGTRLFAQEV